MPEGGLHAGNAALAVRRASWFSGRAGMASTDLLTNLLRDVSRSFYLTLRVLPAPVRRQIGLAYLLARATDTIADTALVPVERRLQALDELRGRIQGSRSRALNLDQLAKAQPALPGGGLHAERVLLERIEEAIAALGQFNPQDQRLIRAVLETITGGQELDLRRFEVGEEHPTSNIQHPTSKEGALRSLRTMEELDDYTYRVAGCVGEFWTKICRANLFPDHRFADYAGFVGDGVRFGKGLQLVNILRDLPRDLRQGRCYIPSEELSKIGLRAEDLLKPENEANFRPLYDSLLALASDHLAAGWRYTCTNPTNQRRVRLACAWPILIGAETLRLLKNGRVLEPTTRIKVPKARVRSILLGSVVKLPFRGSWERQFKPA